MTALPCGHPLDEWVEDSETRKPYCMKCHRKLEWAVLTAAKAYCVKVYHLNMTSPYSQEGRDLVNAVRALEEAEANG